MKISHGWRMSATAIVYVIGAACMLSGVTASAGFTMNFDRAPSDIRKKTSIGTDELHAQCFRHDGNNFNCERLEDGIDPDRTPFLQEVVTDGVNDYYHNIIGDPSTGFAIEYYIQIGGCCWPNGFPRSASGGGYNGGLDASPISNKWALEFSSPLDSNPWIGGNGTAIPDRVIYRQVMLDTEIEQEIIKATFSDKPIITQSIHTADFDSYFVADMSGLHYDDNETNFTTAGTLINTMSAYDDASRASLVAEFDMATDVQYSNVTTGQYVFDAYIRPYGNYRYNGGSFNAIRVDWEAYRDPDPTVNVPDTLP